jgi:hypothetical protein
MPYRNVLDLGTGASDIKCDQLGTSIIFNVHGLHRDTRIRVTCREAGSLKDLICKYSGRQ